MGRTGSSTTTPGPPRKSWTEFGAATRFASGLIYGLMTDRGPRGPSSAARRKAADGDDDAGAYTRHRHCEVERERKGGNARVSRKRPPATTFFAAKRHSVDPPVCIRQIRATGVRRPCVPDMTRSGTDGVIITADCLAAASEVASTGENTCERPCLVLGRRGFSWVARPPESSPAIMSSSSESPISSSARYGQRPLGRFDRRRIRASTVPRGRTGRRPAALSAATA